MCSLDSCRGQFASPSLDHLFRRRKTWQISTSLGLFLGPLGCWADSVLDILASFGELEKSKFATGGLQVELFDLSLMWYKRRKVSIKQLMINDRLMPLFTSPVFVKSLCLVCLTNAKVKRNVLQNRSRLQIFASAGYSTGEAPKEAEVNLHLTEN